MSTGETSKAVVLMIVGITKDGALGEAMTQVHADGRCVLISLAGGMGFERDVRVPGRELARIRAGVDALIPSLRLERWDSRRVPAHLRTGGDVLVIVREDESSWVPADARGLEALRPSLDALNRAMLQAMRAR